MTSKTLSAFDRARAYLAKLPPAIQGCGGDDQTYRAACVAWDFGLSEAEAFTLLREYNARCIPPWSEADLWRKIRSVMNSKHDKPRGWRLGPGPREHRAAPSMQATPAPKREAIDPATAAENYLNGFRFSECDLWEASPIRPEDWREDFALTLSWLYRPGELVNYVTEFDLRDGGKKATPKGTGTVCERDELLRRIEQNGTPESEAGGWLRMNPVDGRGVGDGNVTAFRYALLESDQIPLDLQISLLAKLPLSIAAILTSGGRSVHAWVRVHAPDAEAYRAHVSKLLSILGKFGIDGKNRNPSRLSRLPGAQRKIGAEGDGRQRLLYLNPDAKQGRICER